jgi:cell division septation protein DedD
MAESKIRNAFSRSTILTVGRLLAFVVVGFAVGLVLGIASEEPELLAGHARGDSETVELDDALAARPDEDVEAAARAARVEAEFEAEELAIVFDDAPPMELPDVSAGPMDGGPETAQADATAESAPTSGSSSSVGAGGGSWAIQVGAFGDEPSAIQLADRLEGKGYPIEVLPAGADSNRWRVRVQPIDGEATARTTAERVEREERLPTWVIRLEGQARP